MPAPIDFRIAAGRRRAAGFGAMLDTGRRH